VNKHAKWTRQIYRGALQEPNKICVISCDLFFVSDSMGAANIVNWNHFDCVVTHTVRLYASVESAATITGGHWREYAWLKICTCESIIGFAILRGITGGDAKKVQSILRTQLLLLYNFASFTDSRYTSFLFKDRRSHVSLLLRISIYYEICADSCCVRS